MTSSLEGIPYTYLDMGGGQNIWVPTHSQKWVLTEFEKKKWTTHPIWYPVLTEIWKNFFGTTQFGTPYQRKFEKNCLGPPNLVSGTN